MGADRFVRFCSASFLNDRSPLLPAVGFLFVFISRLTFPPFLPLQACLSRSTSSSVPITSLHSVVCALCATHPARDSFSIFLPTFSLIQFFSPRFSRKLSPPPPRKVGIYHILKPISCPRHRPFTMLIPAEPLFFSRLPHYLRFRVRYADIPSYARCECVHKSGRTDRATMFHKSITLDPFSSVYPVLDFCFSFVRIISFFRHQTTLLCRARLWPFFIASSPTSSFVFFPFPCSELFFSQFLFPLRKLPFVDK